MLMHNAKAITRLDFHLQQKNINSLRKTLSDCFLMILNIDHSVTKMTNL